jgi:hypothetical protein
MEGKSWIQFSAVRVHNATFIVSENQFNSLLAIVLLLHTVSRRFPLAKNRLSSGVKSYDGSFHCFHKCPSNQVRALLSLAECHLHWVTPLTANL